MTAVERRRDAARLRRVDKKLERQALHVEMFTKSIEDPLTKDVAFGICRNVYGQMGCACEKRPDMDVCSSMKLAALGAIRRVRRVDGDGER